MLLLRNLADVFCGGATTSQAITARDDDHYQLTLFKLKRTHLLGLLDEFIPGKPLFVQPDYPHLQRADHRDSLADIPGLADVQDMPADLQGLVASADGQPDMLDGLVVDGLDVADMADFPGLVVDTPPAGLVAAPAAATPAAAAAASPATATAIAPAPPSHQPQAASPSTHIHLPPLVPTEVQLHDDNDLGYEPLRHVDYLLHNWQETDIHKLWRYIVGRRKEMANSARLENASWRTWAQAKYHLKTVLPEVLDWSKDTDVTWLYGPICRDNHQLDMLATPLERLPLALKRVLLAEGFDVSKKSTSKARLAPGSLPLVTSAPTPATPEHLPQAMPTKPILKKRTVQEIILSHSGLIRDTMRARSPDPEEFHPRTPDTHAADPHLATLPLVMLMLPNGHATTTSPPERLVHFNDRVEQCIALDVLDDDTDTTPTMHERMRRSGARGAFLFSDSESDDDDERGEEESRGRSAGRFALDPSDSSSSEEDGDEEDDEDEEGDEDLGFFLSVPPSTANLSQHFATPASASTTPASLHSSEADGVSHGHQLPLEELIASESLSTPLEMLEPRSIRTIERLAPTTLNYGSDDEDTLGGCGDLRGSSIPFLYDYSLVYTGDVGGVQVVDCPDELDLELLNLGDRYAPGVLN